MRYLALATLFAAFLPACGDGGSRSPVVARTHLMGRAGYAVGLPGSYEAENVDPTLSRRLTADTWVGVKADGTLLRDTWLEFYPYGNRHYFEMRLGGVPVRGELYERKASGGADGFFRGMVQQPTSWLYNPAEFLNGSRLFGRLENRARLGQVLHVTFERPVLDEAAMEFEERAPLWRSDTHWSGPTFSSVSDWMFVSAGRIRIPAEK